MHYALPYLRTNLYAHTSLTNLYVHTSLPSLTRVQGLVPAYCVQMSLPSQPQ